MPFIPFKKGQNKIAPVKVAPVKAAPKVKPAGLAPVATMQNPINGPHLDTANTVGGQPGHHVYR